MDNLPAFFLSHGGGPWPYMQGEFRQHFLQLERSLQALPASLPSQPKAVVMISSHWEGPEFLISSAAKPGMVYDYSGFPAETYQISYPAPGQPELAHAIERMLKTSGLSAKSDPERGFDHGSFSLMAVLYPDAQMPLVQISLRSDYDLEVHWQLGRSLAPLRQQGVLLIGSGLSYHNLAAFGVRGQLASQQFDEWLSATVIEASPAQRRQALLNWQSAPAARQAHPREDHLLPLLVVAGAAEADVASHCYHQTDFMGALTVSSYRFA